MNILSRAVSFLLILTMIAAPVAHAENIQETADTASEISADVDTAEIDESEFTQARETVAGAVPEISSPSAILVEASSGDVIYEKDADARREPASVTKIMTELLVVEALEAGIISLDDEVTTSTYASSMGGSQIYLKEGEKMSLEDMLKAVIINSANDAAVALAEHVAGSEPSFVSMMNARAAELGMTSTSFTNCSGLLDSAEHYTTARDIAIMSCELMRHDIIRDYTTIWMDSLRDGATSLVNTNRLVHYYDGTTGLKTGFTQKAGYCLSASAEREGVGYISVTLGDASSNDRFDSARTLLSYAFATYTTIPSVPDEVLLPIKVDLGETRYIQPEVSGPEKILLTRSDAGQLTKTVELANQLLAPVNEGDEVGRLKVTVGDRLIADLPIIAGNASSRLGWGDIFGKFLSLLFSPSDS